MVKETGLLKRREDEGDTMKKTKNINILLRGDYDYISRR